MADVTHEATVSNLEEHGQPTPPKPAPVVAGKPPTKDAAPAPIVLDFIKAVEGGFAVMSESGKQLGKFKTRAAARKRLAQIEYFRNQKK
jgi:hypothetical protein